MREEETSTLSGEKQEIQLLISVAATLRLDRQFFLMKKMWCLFSIFIEKTLIRITCSLSFFFI
jgi:hypothetical protein